MVYTYIYTHTHCYILAGNATYKPFGKEERREREKREQLSTRECQPNTVHSSLTKNLTEAHTAQKHIQLTAMFSFMLWALVLYI